ncbi:MAG: DUF4912 domain-containing protein [Heliobacteriaceae bacterium]|nr:DUF4912 domain-containing protein [Heliobacteriaceae bacterium]MDD4588091.1 DUF4912 domain-containing protein [Heliobacteriaceae bacterium]
MEQLPQAYDQDYLGILVLDPQQMFIYWELSSLTAKAVRAREGETTLELQVRLFAGTGETGKVTWHIARQVTLPPETGHMYLNGLPPGAVCRVLIGNVAGPGCFNVLLTSEPVALPPVRPGETKESGGKESTVGAGERPELLGRPVGVPGSPAWLAGWHS